jgi:hypothetical protein
MPRWRAFTPPLTSYRYGAGLAFPFNNATHSLKNRDMTPPRKIEWFFYL